MMTYNHYRNLKHFCRRKDFLYPNDKIIIQIKITEKENPEWLYRICRECLEHFLRNKESIS